MTLALSQPTRGELIRRINDRCRHSFTGCFIVLTAAVAELDPHTKAIVLHRVRTFKDFDAGNNPHDENDMAFFEVDGARYFWKFDYFGDPNYRTGSDDPSDTGKTWRCLTVGFASDY
jgi:hypothetical protein